MRIRYLPSGTGNESHYMYLTTYVVNETLAIDAGCLGYWDSPAEQSKITDIIITHSHLDHIGSLPMFLNNVYDGSREPVRLYASHATEKAIRSHVFDDTTWTKLDNLLRADPPLLDIRTFEAGDSIEVAGVQIKAVSVNHPIPTIGVILTDEYGSVAISSDTGPTEEFWKACAEADRLQAVFLECSFPNEMEKWALEWGHLTPALFEAELAKIGRPVRAIAMHLKSSCHDVVVDQLSSVANAEIVDQSKTYVFEG